MALVRPALASRALRPQVQLKNVTRLYCSVVCSLPSDAMPFSGSSQSARHASFNATRRVFHRRYDAISIRVRKLFASKCPRETYGKQTKTSSLVLLSAALRPPAFVRMRPAGLFCRCTAFRGRVACDYIVLSLFTAEHIVRDILYSVHYCTQYSVGPINSNSRN